MVSTNYSRMVTGIIVVNIRYNTSMNFFLNQNKVDLFWQFVISNFKMRYQNSVLGVLWVLIKPYATFTVMYFIWSKISDADVENFALFLLIGVVIYTFFNELILGGQNALLERAHVILKVNFPRQIAIMSALTSAFINLIINLLLVFVILFVTGNSFSLLYLPYLFFVVTTIWIFGVAIAFFSSVLTIRFRDLTNIFELGLFLLFWVTPIFYTLDDSRIEGWTTRIVSSNPLGVVINQVRASLGVYGEINFEIMIVYFISSVILAYLGWIYFNRAVQSIVEYY